MIAKARHLRQYTPTQHKEMKKSKALKNQIFNLFTI